MDRDPGTLRLDCPIPSRISPHADAAHEWLVDWLRRFDLPMDEKARNRLVQGGFARYAARLYPDASSADLRALAAIFTWFFLVDDACDDPAGPRPRQVRALRDGVVRLLRGGERGGARSADHAFPGPLRRMLRDVWRTPRRRMPPRWRDRFVDTVAHHLDGVLVEVSNRAAGRRPTVTEYVALRRATSAAYVSYTLIEFTSGLPVPDAVYHHPAVQAVAATGNDLLSWFNDLVSLRRDMAGAGGHNLILAIAHEQGLPVAEALQVAAERWQRTMHRFVELRAAVPSFGPDLDEPLRHHLDGVANSVRGTIDWSLESGRYRFSDGPAVTVPPYPRPAVSSQTSGS
nr:terpene synthase [Micromonospora sp. DSM 115978]